MDSSPSISTTATKERGDQSSGCGPADPTQGMMADGFGKALLDVQIREESGVLAGDNNSAFPDALLEFGKFSLRSIHRVVEKLEELGEVGEVGEVGVAEIENGSLPVVLPKASISRRSSAVVASKGRGLMTRARSI